MADKKKYVDGNGLLYFWQKIKMTFAQKATTLSGYGITDAMTSEEVNNAINTALGNITGVEFQIVKALPQNGAAGVIYLLDNGGSEAQNIYDEYIYANGGFEKIGTTAVDLSGYVQTADLEPVTNTEIDTITAS